MTLTPDQGRPSWPADLFRVPLEERTIVKALLGRAERSPDSPLVTYVDGPRLSAQDQVDRALQAGGALLAAGAAPGDRVVIFCGNHPFFLDAYLGATLAGLIPVPLNVSARGMSLEQMLADARPRVAVVDTEYLEVMTSALAEVGEKISPACSLLIVNLTTVTGGHDDFAAACAAANPCPVSNPTANELALILYTSGTTGPSKGVMIPHGMTFGWVDNRSWSVNLSPDDVSFSPLPLFHVGTLFNTVLAVMATGGEAAIAERFSATRYWQQVRETSSSVLFLVGSMLPILWAQPPGPGDRDHRARMALVVPCPTATFAQFEARFGVTLTSSFGMTDIGTIMGVPFGQHMRPGSTGIPLPTWECDIVDELDRPVGPDEIGELVARPRVPWLMQLGYWNRPVETLASWRNLWFHTGDRFRRDGDGWYFFVDRAKDSIRRAGENISSFEVEAAIARHPAVADVAVFPVPSELAEDEVMAIVTWRDNAEIPSFVELAVTTGEHIAYFAVPRYWEALDEMPRTETEKIRKTDLRRRGVADTTTDLGRAARSAMREAAK